MLLSVGAFRAQLYLCSLLICYHGNKYLILKNKKMGFNKTLFQIIWWWWAVFVSLKIISPAKLFDFQSHGLEHAQTISKMWKHLWNLWENTIPKSSAQNKPTRNNNVQSSETYTLVHTLAHPGCRP